MKSFKKHLILVLTVVLILSGCKQPIKEIDATKAAIEDVTKAGAEKCAAEELKKLNDDLAAALDEINAQDRKIFKKFGNAKEILAKIRADAETLKAELPAKIEAARNKAIALQTEAQDAINEAKSLLMRAPKGKNIRKDINALKADLAGIEATYTEIQTAIDAQDYCGAADRAKSVKENTVAISDKVKAGIFIISGTLVRENGIPVKTTIRVHKVTEKGYSIETGDEGVVLNPSVESDKDGNFLILMDPAFLGEKREITLTVAVSGWARQLTDSRDIPLIFKIQEKVMQLKLGKIIVK